MITRKSKRKTFKTQNDHHTTYRLLHRPKSQNEGRIITGFDLNTKKKLIISAITYKKNNNNQFTRHTHFRLYLNVRNHQVYAYIFQYQHWRCISNDPSKLVNFVAKEFWSENPDLRIKHIIKFSRKFQQMLAQWARKHKIQMPHPQSGTYHADVAFYLLNYPALRSLLYNLKPKKSRQPLPIFKKINPHIPQQISRCLRQPTFHLAVHKLMGQSNKRLIRALYQSMQICEDWLIPLAVARLFKKYLPIDYIYEILENPQVMKSFMEHSFVIREALNNPKALSNGYKLRLCLQLFPPQKWKRFFLSPEFNAYQEFGPNLTDLPNLIIAHYNYGLKLPENYTSIKDFHDQIVRHQNEYYRNHNIPHHRRNQLNQMIDNQHDPISLIPVNQPLPIHFKDFESQDFKFVCPEDSNTLQKWGEILHNCLGSYTRYAQKTGIIIGVFQKEKLTYAIAIRKGPQNYIEQFYGVCNQNPVEQHKITILQILKDNKLIADPNTSNSTDLNDRAPLLVNPDEPDQLEEYYRNVAAQDEENFRNSVQEAINIIRGLPVNQPNQLAQIVRGLPVNQPNQPNQLAQQPIAQI